MHGTLPYSHGVTFNLNDDDAPIGAITDARLYLDLSLTSSESTDHDPVSSQSSLSKAFQHAFFATRSRVLKVCGVCGIASLTRLTWPYTVI